MYKLKIDKMYGQEFIAILRINDNGSITSFDTDPANTDYANFKKEILADEAQLQDADGNLMTNAKDYVRTLP